MSLIDQLQAAPPDPIFGIAKEAADAGPDAINATVGMIVDDAGKPLLFPSMAQAARSIATVYGEQPFAYPPVLGVTEFRESVCGLLGLNSAVTASIAATGGTGALAIQLRLLSRIEPGIRLIVQVPTWPNHFQLLQDAHAPWTEVEYLIDGRPSIEGIARELASAPAAVLLQGGCHNPLGLDYDRARWEAIADLLAQHDSVALLDMAYQGLYDEPEDDRMALEILRSRNVLTLVSWSASKNHSVYGLRAGLACVEAGSEEQKNVIESHYVPITRGMHSAASIAGQQIVATVQRYHHEAWRADLADVRARLKQIRAFLQSQCPPCAAALSGNGMFALLPLTPEQIQQLKDRKIFLTNDGRINIAGIPPPRIEHFAQELKAVL